MSPPPFPSITEKIKSPAFAMAWLGPTFYDDFSIIAYGGGGGSARTGVANHIAVLSIVADKQSKSNVLDSTSKMNKEPFSHVRSIDTGDQICVGIELQHYGPKLEQKRLLAAIGTEIRYYDALTGDLLGSQEVGNEGSNAVAISPCRQRCVVGCENGRVLLYSIIESNLNKTNEGTKGNEIEFKLISTFNGHIESSSNKKGVCSITFSPSNKFFLSSSRDGTARVCDSKTGAPLCCLECSITESDSKKPSKKTPILVRGCSFGFDENIIYTCQSGRRGPAYCSIWRLNTQSSSPQYQEILRKCVSPKPISSMSMSGDKSTIIFGNVEGSVFLYYADSLDVRRKFEEIHDLPVTCVAAWPAGMGFNRFVVVSASADNKLAFLSMKTLPRSKMLVLIWLLMLIVGGGLCRTWYYECKNQFFESNLDAMMDCMKHSILAPEDRPGIAFVPY